MLDEIQAFWILAGFVLTAEVLFENKGRDHVVFAALCFGVATACKWNGLFAAGGAWLALMGGVTGGRCGDDPVPYPRRSWGHRLGCTLIFLFCGILVYAAAYIPFLLTEGSAGLESWQKIYGFHERMIRFRYDAAQFNHRYLSQFYEWPLVLRPVWYYYVESESVVQGIVGIGCVVFWWPAFFLILESLWLGYRGVLPRASVPPDPLAQFVCCFYFPQWVLWASSTTGGFFYYMIPVVPIMAVAMARHLDELLSQEGNQGKTLATGYLAFLFLCTVAYYPLLTGISVSEGYFRFLFFVERWI